MSVVGQSFLLLRLQVIRFMAVASSAAARFTSSFRVSDTQTYGAPRLQHLNNVWIIKGARTIPVMYRDSLACEYYIVQTANCMIAQCHIRTSETARCLQ